MAAPATINEFLDLVRKSGVLDENRLAAYLQMLNSSGAMPSEPSKLAGLMVRDGYLTHFQAEQIMLGKWRRFTIGKYKVLERLGSGGMGSVYLCEHKLMRRRVAVKVLPAAKAADPSSLERFYREARAVAALDHANIVHAYDIDQDENLHFLVMEYVDGASMQELVKKSGPMDPLRAAHYIRQAAIGLEHAHLAGLVHRDIKPGNILVDRTGMVKLLDMGLARFFNDEDDVLTKKYDENVLGTADYLAPEQALDSHGVDIRADIYSLGATFYFLLTGRTPFGEGTVAQKLIWHQTRQPKPITIYRTDVPPGLTAILEQMMAKDPAQRFQLPAHLIQALEPWTQTPIPPPSEKEMPRLSLAATGGGPPSPETATVVTSQAGGSGPATPAKVWTVTTTPSPSPRSPQPLKPATGPLSPAPFSPPPAPAPLKATSSVGVPGVVPPKAPAKADIPPPTIPRRPASLEQKPPPPVSKPATPAPAPAIPPVAVQTPSPPAPAASEPQQQVEEEVSWEDLAADTEDPSAQADTPPTGQRPPLRKRPQRRLSPVVDARRRWIVQAGVGVFGAVVILWMVWFLFLRNRDASPTLVQRPPLTVSKDANRSGAFRLISSALAQAQDGDVIELADDRHEESLKLIGGDLSRPLPRVTIKPAAGKHVTWRPSSKNPRTPLLTLYKAAGVHIQGPGLTLDGTIDAAKKVFVKDLVWLTLASKGVVLDNVDLRGFSNTAVFIMNCSGEPDQPVRLQQIQVTVSADIKPLAAIYFDAHPTTTPRMNDHIYITTDCRFYGIDSNEAIKLKAPGVNGPNVHVPR